jgi:hypothetical protein
MVSYYTRRVGVPEVWRYAGRRIEILGLDLAGGEGYEAIAESRALSPLTNDVLARFIEEGLTSRRPAWVREVREWARDRLARPEDG